MTETGCILVCVTQQKECERLIRRGKAEALQHRLPLHIIHVNTGKNYLGNPNAGDALNYLYALAREADAEMNILYSTDVMQAISGYARQQDAKVLILGADRSGFTNTLSMLLPLCQIITNPS